MYYDINVNAYFRNQILKLPTLVLTFEMNINLIMLILTTKILYLATLILYSVEGLGCFLNSVTDEPTSYSVFNFFSFLIVSYKSFLKFIDFI